MDLMGLNIWVTRPQAQALVWAQQLEQLGATTCCQPILGIAPLLDETSKQAIKQQILALDECQKAIFVSQNAVSFGAEWIDQYWPQLPMGLHIFAIGRATASLLEETLSDIDSTVIAPAQAMNSEALLERPELQDLQNEKILILRGKGGRGYLAQILKDRGARVSYCELYQRIIPTKIDLQIINQFRQSTETPVIAVHSGETLSNLCSVLSSTVKDDLPWFKQQALLVPGKRVADEAKQFGFQTIIIAENATHESMIEALYDWRQQNS